ELVAPGGRPGRPGGLLRARGGARARLLGLGGGGRAGDGETCGEGERGGDRRELRHGDLLRSSSARSRQSVTGGGSGVEVEVAQGDGRAQERAPRGGLDRGAGRAAGAPG